ncbi:hypothetical protein CW705_03055 [Candidatus Bathyarchaeota archaeon]|nr:MAG: hypothetical protein CW705_03055 [Candidatus Bathyarchaeota archaeon]
METQTSMPIKCKKCRSADAEISLPYAGLSLCPECFLEYYVNRIARTVKKYKMFREDEAVGVAVSGGKDSAALLHGLHKAFPDQEFFGLHVNLGIPKYSDHIQKKAEEITNLVGIKLYVFNLEKEEGISLDDFKKTIFGRKICSVCGTIKRHVFEELARNAGVEVLATGHNMDDILGFMFNNFFSGQWLQLIRLKPVLPPLIPGMTRKIKPLISTPERESLLYCLYAEIPFREMNCPYSRGTKTKERLKMLEVLSQNNPSFRHQALKSFLKLSSILEKSVEQPKVIPCKICGFPSTNGTCAYCKRIAYLSEKLKSK